ncbi:MAG: cupredoxin domain-containing protein [Chloroflexi bacterium]|nr:cupredoxin domain-containing protein [Chloroflexota bacterium]MCI0890111.1 cupredoxin domain-containing protein [Chloroflexota bacterium]
MKRDILWIGSMATLLVVAVITLSFAACGAGDNGSDSTPAATVADDDHAGDDDPANDGTADHDADADDHDADVGDNGADADLQAFAYLEAAPKDQLYLVEMTSFAYAPEVLEVGAGEVLEIAVQNVEAVLHDFTIDEIDADVHVSYLAGTGQHGHAESQLDADVHFALTEAGTGVVHIKIHEPGEYVFYCSVPGHREAGMEGTLIVR